MKVILDAGCMENKEETHEYLKEKLELPGYYGNNLDALYDCLTEMGESEITFINTEAAGAYFKPVCRVCMRAEKENPGLHLTGIPEK